MKIVMVLGSKMAHIFSAYAPQQGRTDEERRQFRELLEDKIAEVPVTDIGYKYQCRRIFTYFFFSEKFPLPTYKR